MQQRRVTAPDNTRWNIGRRWLLQRPLYFGYRFGRAKREPDYEPPLGREVKRKPAPTKRSTPPPVRYTSSRSRRRRSGSGFSGYRRTSRRGSGSSASWASRGARRSGGGGSRGRSSGGGKRRGGGGGGGAAAGGALASLLRFLKNVAIAALVIAVIVFMIFVGIPALVFLAQYAAFWIAAGATVLYRALTGRPWIVEMEEADGYRIRSWRVKGWADSKSVIDEIARSIRSGQDPNPDGAEEVDIINADENLSR
ncbi:MAG: hypothetical protein GY722_16325 [bacterium]|nr:hypothetical protein [bacterium]